MLYRIVVVRSAWPASSWIAFAGALRIARPSISAFDEVTEQLISTTTSRAGMGG